MTTFEADITLNFKYNLPAGIRIMTTTYDLVKRIAFAVLGLTLIGYGYWLQSGGRNAASDKSTPVTNATIGTTESRAPALVKVPIKDIRVGTRVPAFNPEVSAAERRDVYASRIGIGG
jgi:hypothetical protein